MLGCCRYVNRILNGVLGCCRYVNRILNGVLGCCRYVKQNTQWGAGLLLLCKQNTQWGAALLALSKQSTQWVAGLLSLSKLSKKILGTTPPTDILHRALLINTALIPIYNHIFMALPVQKEMTKRPHQEILDFLWTKQHDGETIKKRRLVTKDRIPASFNRGGL